VLAFYTPNSIDTAVVTSGLLFAGGVASPANPTYTVEELAFQLTDSGAKAVATQLPLLGTVRAAAAKVGIPEDRVILLGDGRDESGKFKHFTAITSKGWYSRTKVDPKKDLAFLVYSSGTTGLPKGVCLSHYNVVANILQMREIEGRAFLPDGGPDGKGDKMLGVLPFFHIYVSPSQGASPTDAPLLLYPLKLEEESLTMVCRDSPAPSSCPCTWAGS
jgi:acyl-CoA synthetase (AMP-forming)/AMP-acid ligase II